MRTMWRSVILAVTVAVATAAVVLALIFRFWLPPRENYNPTPRYVIGNWQGQVAVFEGGQDYPMLVYDTYINALPEEARQQVLAGIPVEDATRLSLLLEDYID